MRRTIKISMSVGIGVMLLGAVICLSLLRQSRPDISLERLLPEAPVFPDAWTTGELDAGPINWQIAWTYLEISPEAEYYASESAGRAWTNGGKLTSAPKIFVGIYKYSSPLQAWLRFWLSRPEITEYGDWPNFPYHPEDRYPASWSYLSPYADQMHVTCGMGGPESCQVWYYWAQYGQYILMVQFFGPNRGMDTTLFSEVVKEIDADIGKKWTK